MQEYVNKILKILKEHVSQNNLEIQLNQDEIKQLIVLEKLSRQESDDLDYKNALNKELINENDDFLKLQLKMTAFIEKYGHLFPDVDDRIEEEDEYVLPYFKKTIKGEMAYGPAHPQFNNNHFFDELLKYYQDNEDYEMCDQLIKVKRSYKKF